MITISTKVLNVIHSIARVSFTVPYMSRLGIII